MEAIKISISVFDSKMIKKIEKVMAKTHCGKYKVQVGAMEICVLVPRHKTQITRKLLTERGIKNY